MFAKVGYTIYNRPNGALNMVLAGITVSPTPSMTRLELDDLIVKLQNIRKEMDAVCPIKGKSA